jgi:uncharacterized protein YndB with AHSA1/START domain
MQNEIKHTRYFSQSPQEVWEYFTKPDLLERWLGKTDFKPVEGYKFRFMSPYGNDSHCEVLEVKPFTRLSYSWQKNSAKDNQRFHSTIVWTLVPKENGTELQLVHRGFAFSEDYTGHNEGWNTCLQQLEDLLKTHNEKAILHHNH